MISHVSPDAGPKSSFSGSVVEGFGFPAGDSPERIAALRGASGELPDTVLIYMGINDYGWGGRGTRLDRRLPAGRQDVPSRILLGMPDG